MTSTIGPNVLFEILAPREHSSTLEHQLDAQPLPRELQRVTAPQRPPLSTGDDQVAFHPPVPDSRDALAQTGKLFNLPTIITTSASDGPNGPVLPEIPRILPDAKVIHRPGEVNGWDNAEFVAAVEALSGARSC